MDFFRPSDKHTLNIYYKIWLLCVAVCKFLAVKSDVFVSDFMIRFKRCEHNSKKIVH